MYSELGPNSGLLFSRLQCIFFLNDTCIDMIKSSGVRKVCPNSKFPDKSSAGLTRFDCNSKRFPVN